MLSWLVVVPKWRDLLQGTAVGYFASAVLSFTLVASVLRSVLDRTGFFLGMTWIIYITFAVYSQTFTLIDPISERILTPAIVPLGFYIAHALSAMCKRKFAGAVLVSATGAVLLLNYTYSLRSAITNNKYGMGYNIAERWSPEQISQIRKLLENGRPLFSNDPYLLRYVSMIEPVLNIPTGPAFDLEAFCNTIKPRGGVLVWWEASTAATNLSISQIDTIERHEELRRHEYRVFLLCQGVSGEFKLIH